MSKGALGLVFFFAVAIISWIGFLYREFFRDVLKKRSRYLDPSQSEREKLEFKKYWSDLTEEEREEMISAAYDPLGKEDVFEVDEEFEPE